MAQIKVNAKDVTEDNVVSFADFKARKAQKNVVTSNNVVALAA